MKRCFELIRLFCISAQGPDRLRKELLRSDLPDETRRAIENVLKRSGL